MTDSRAQGLSRFFTQARGNKEAASPQDFTRLEGRVVHLGEVGQQAGKLARAVNGPVLGTLQAAFWDFERHVTEVYERAAQDIPTWYPYPEMPLGKVSYYGHGMNLRNEELKDMRRLSYVDAPGLCAAVAASHLPAFEKRVLRAAVEKCFNYGPRAHMTNKLYDRDNPPTFTPRQIMESLSRRPGL